MDEECGSTEIARSPRLHVATRVQDMDTASLHSELARVLTVTAETILYLAEIWKELQRRGEDLSELRTGVAQFLPLIASGQLRADVIVRFAGRQHLLRAVAALPVEEQKRLASGGKVETIHQFANGRVEPILVAASDMTVAQVKLAFDYGRIRSVGEQTNLATGRNRSVRRQAALRRKYRVNVEMTTETVTVGRMTVPLSEVLDALRRAGALDKA